MARDPNAHNQCGDAKNHEHDGMAEIHRDLFNSRRRDVKSSNDLFFVIVTDGILAALEPGCARRLPQSSTSQDVFKLAVSGHEHDEAMSQGDWRSRKRD